MMSTETKALSILSVPFGYGAGRRGTEFGPEAIRLAGLNRQLKELGFHIDKEVTLPVPSESGETHPNLKYLNEIIELNTNLAAEVAGVVNQGAFPLVLGGDHSIAIGTLGGLVQKYKNLGVIWFDAHADLNTEETSPSGNIHGMSLGVAMGRGPSLLTQIKGAGPNLKPENIVLIGTRQLDQGERDFIRSSGIKCFTMHDIDRKGMSAVMDEALAIVTNGTDGVHLSFDIDSLDPLEAPGTGTKIPGGVSYREAHFALELMCESKKITSAEFVEVNPSLDSGNKTARLAVELIASLLGQRIL
ncbi:arginase [Paenibacillus swuensis]|uniref:Arginase n=1 Tax=Paenibacillus swuensis TaxID=1178515 RepID=A0A172TED3_9BACL|nr:arginase [Paenibacillus swuensis]ANE45370.1 arginase [Paenibacillus swuensis]